VGPIKEEKRSSGLFVGFDAGRFSDAGEKSIEFLSEREQYG
jgi:hypothetical protein